MVNFRDPRSTSGIFSRGSNVYRGGSNSPTNNTRTRPRPIPPVRPGAQQWRPSMGSSMSSSANPGSFERPGANVSRPGYTAPGQQPVGPQSPPGNPHSPGTSPQTYEQLMQQIMASLPGLNTFDAQYEEFQRLLDQQRGHLEVTGEREQDRINNLYSVILERLQQSLTGTLEQNTFNMADRGILRSGINVREQGRINEGFAQQDADTRGQQASDLESLLSSITNALNELNMQGQQSEIDRAWRAQQAQQAQAMVAAQAAAGIYAQQYINQQPQPSPTGQYGPGQGGYTPPSLNPTTQMSMWGGGPNSAPRQPYTGTSPTPSNMQQAPNFNRSPAPSAPSTRSSISGPGRSAYIPSPTTSPPAPQTNMSGAIERRLRRF